MFARGTLRASIEGHCPLSHQDSDFPSHQIGMWLFGLLGLRWRVAEFVISAVSFFFSLRIIPRLQPHLPLGFVGGRYEQSGWLFVEACAVSCEHLTQNETNMHVCFARARCADGIGDEPWVRFRSCLFVCVFFATLRLPFPRSSSMTTVAWTCVSWRSMTEAPSTSTGASGTW